MYDISLVDGVKVRILIAESGNTLRSFAHQIGVSHAYLSQVLNGRRNPSPVFAHKIAKGLGVEIDNIFLIKVVG